MRMTLTAVALLFALVVGAPAVSAHTSPEQPQTGSSQCENQFPVRSHVEPTSSVNRDWEWDHSIFGVDAPYKAQWTGQQIYTDLDGDNVCETMVEEFCQGTVFDGGPSTFEYDWHRESLTFTDPGRTVIHIDYKSAGANPAAQGNYAWDKPLKWGHCYLNSAIVMGDYLTTANHLDGIGT